MRARQGWASGHNLTIRYAGHHPHPSQDVRDQRGWGIRWKHRNSSELTVLHAQASPCWVQAMGTGTHTKYLKPTLIWTQIPQSWLCTDALHNSLPCWQGKRQGYFWKGALPEQPRWADRQPTPSLGYPQLKGVGNMAFTKGFRP